MDEQQEPKTVRQDFLLPSKSSRLGTVKLEEIYLVGNYPNEISAGKELGRYIRYNQGQSKIVDAAASAAAQPGIEAQLNAALAQTQTDLGAILADLHISDKTKVAQINALVTFVISEVAAVQSLLPSAAPTTARRVPTSAKQFKKGFNSIMKSADSALVLK